MKVLYAKNNNDRSEEYQLRTIIFEENSKRFVKKEAMCAEAIPHLKQIKWNYDLLNETITNTNVKLAKILSYDSQSIIFEYIKGESFEKIISNSFQNKNQTHRLDDCLQTYIDFIYNSFDIGIVDRSDSCNENSASKNSDVFCRLLKDTKIKEPCFKNSTNIDLIFSNIIISNDVYYIIDYEWVVKKSLPVNFVIFRALINSAYWKEFQSCSVAQKILNNRKYYEEIDNSFQLEVCRKDSFFRYKPNYLKPIQSKIELDKQLDEVLQTKSWKITAPLRWLLSKLLVN